MKKKTSFTSKEMMIYVSDKGLENFNQIFLMKKATY